MTPWILIITTLIPFYFSVEYSKSGIIFLAICMSTNMIKIMALDISIFLVLSNYLMMELVFSSEAFNYICIWQNFTHWNRFIIKGMMNIMKNEILIRKYSGVPSVNKSTHVYWITNAIPGTLPKIVNIFGSRLISFISWVFFKNRMVDIS